MKPLDLFVVQIESRTQDTIKTASGLELYVDTKFDEFNHRTTEAEVVAVPCKYETGVTVGDTLYFHHLVVLNDGQPLTGEDQNYIVKYSPDAAINNQAIAFKSKETGEVKPLCGWTLLESCEEDTPGPDTELELVKFKKDPVLKGVVSFDTKHLKELGVEKGDTVGFAKNMDYRIVIDEKEYYRVPADRIFYKEI